ncbi:unnamed protein product [Mesocestoides corti]|uniref:Transposase n=1 Tax=Mesocestoides corti TaxID=53468 RepID=A0A0R3UIE9_MESCO|nr:unnamed protein product [Mesocestoides corti]
MTSTECRKVVAGVRGKVTNGRNAKTGVKSMRNPTWPRAAVIWREQKVTPSLHLQMVCGELVAECAHRCIGYERP